MANGILYRVAKKPSFQAIGIYAVSTILVVMAVSGVDPGTNRTEASDRGALAKFFQWDGEYYLEIARSGYSFDPEEGSNVAFFPLYPLLGRYLAALTGVTLEVALLAVSHLFLAGSFVLLGAYVSTRYPGAGPTGVQYTLLAFGLFPPTFFFRMGYSESSFLFFAVLAMLAMERRWPLPVVAAIVGLATATRPVAVALIPVFCLHVWRCSPCWRAMLYRSVLLVPIALSGLIAYMGYQYVAFDEPLAFAKTQDHWKFRSHVSTGEKALALLSHEPIWSVYDATSEAYWRRIQPGVVAWLNLAFANAIYFILAVALLVVGVRKRWLTSFETILAAQLILIPYFTRSYEMCMASQGRFVAAAFPIYLVWGQIFSRIPGPYAAIIIGVFMFFLTTYASLFAAGYRLI